MTDLVAFLQARLDEDEAIALAAKGHAVAFETTDEGHRHLTRFGASAWVLADIQAKRAILATYAEQYSAARQDVPDPPEFSPYRTGRLAGLNLALRLLAVTYADHADHQPEWKPS